MNNVIERYTNLIRSKYKCESKLFDPNGGIGFIPQKNLLEIVRKNIGARFVIRGHDLICPVTDNGNLMAFTITYNGALLNYKEIQDICSLNDLIIKEYIVGKFQKERLQAVENYIQKSEITDSEKVIPISPILFKNKSLKDIVLSKSQKYYKNNPAFIIDISSSSIKSSALRIHHKNLKKNFIDFIKISKKDLDLNSLFQNSESTIYIEELSELSISTQKFLINLFSNSTQSSTTHAKIIVGTTDAPDSLVKNPLIDNELLFYLCMGDLKVTPHSSKRKQVLDLLEYTFNITSSDHTKPIFLRPKTIS